MNVFDLTKVTEYATMRMHPLKQCRVTEIIYDNVFDCYLCAWKDKGTCNNSYTVRKWCK